jgi:hypothetical protein
LPGAGGGAASARRAAGWPADAFALGHHAFAFGDVSLGCVDFAWVDRRRVGRWFRLAALCSGLRHVGKIHRKLGVRVAESSKIGGRRWRWRWRWRVGSGWAPAALATPGRLLRARLLANSRQPLKR